MKIKLTEQQYKTLLENNLSYTPERIDQFVVEATKLLTDASNLKNKHYTNVVSLSISEVLENVKYYEQLAERMDEDHRIIEKQHDKFYNVVELYDYLDYPENVKNLSKINDKIYDTAQDIYHLSNALEEIVSAVEQINRTDQN